MGEVAPDAERHAQSLNEVAVQLLNTGNFAGALDVLQRAVRAGPASASMWLNVAAALRGLRRIDDESEALKQVFAIDPRNLRALLQMASLQEIQGRQRDAAALYRTALQLIPPGIEVPAEMRPILQHAKDAIDSNQVALEKFLEARLNAVRSAHADVPHARFDRCLAMLLQKQRIFRQQPSFMFFPNLPAIEFYERSDFPWLDSIEAATDDIRAELLAVMSNAPNTLEPYIAYRKTAPPELWRDLNNSRRWSVHYFWREGIPNPENQARCPRTMKALEAWPRCDVPGTAPSAVFSILDAKSRIPPHTGVSNTRLIVHLPLVVPPGCGFRVGGETREWEPGKALIFDDTIEHEVWNDSDVPRAMLIFDIWSPFLSAAERELVRVTTAAVGEYYGTGAYAES
jgi:aspartate beta-hydroxylase